MCVFCENKSSWYFHYPHYVGRAHWFSSADLSKTSCLNLGIHLVMLSTFLFFRVITFLVKTRADASVDDPFSQSLVINDSDRRMRVTLAKHLSSNSPVEEKSQGFHQSVCKGLENFVVGKIAQERMNGKWRREN